MYQSVKLFDAVMDKVSVKTMFFQLTALASLWIALKKQENYYKIPAVSRKYPIKIKDFDKIIFLLDSIFPG